MGNSSRRLRADEKALVIKMVRGQPAENALLYSIQDIKVIEMNDGGMGSLKFVQNSSEKPRFGCQIREATFADMDGVPVSATINLDQNGQLYELDFFKADNSPLMKIPAPDDVFLR